MYNNNVYNKTTKPYRPFWVLQTEEFLTRIDAMIREKYLKIRCRQRSQNAASSEKLVDAHDSKPAYRQAGRVPPGVPACLPTSRFDSGFRYKGW
jgi:hypothetical protein